MLFGDKNKFAIELKLHQGKKYVFINYCLWIKNQMIGDLEETGVMTSEWGLFEDTLALKGKRSCPELLTFSAEEVIEYLIDKIWKDKENNLISHPENLEALKVDFAEGECLLGWYCFLIEAEGYDWFLCKDWNTGQVVDVKIPKETFYTILEKIVSWIQSSVHYVLNPEIDKDETIVEIVYHLKSDRRFKKESIQFSDNWEADLCALGVKNEDRLVYISTNDQPPGEYEVQFEIINPETEDTIREGKLFKVKGTENLLKKVADYLILRKIQIK
jgi:hypothetical protein